MYMVPTKHQDHIRGTGKYESKWETGIWLGVKDESNEIIIGTNQGVLKARSIRRYASHGDRWKQRGNPTYEGNTMGSYSRKRRD